MYFISHNALHAHTVLHVYIRVRTHRKVSLKGLGTTVGGVATDLTGVRHVEAVELVQPVGNGLQWRHKQQTLTHKAQVLHTVHVQWCMLTRTTVQCAAVGKSVGGGFGDLYNYMYMIVHVKSLTCEWV